MTISLVGVATGTTTCTVPAHNVGDIIVIFAFRTASGTAPSLGSGYQSILTKAQGTTGSARVGFKIATSTSDASGTWTNASALVCHVYRSSNYATGSSLYVGGSASAGSTTSTVNFPALTLTHTDGTSWALGFAGCSNTSESVATAPSGMTNQSHETAAASQAAGFDTNGTVSSWSSTNVTETGTAGTTVSCTVEIIENQPGTAINNIVQFVSTAANSLISTAAGNNFIVPFPNPSLSGNTLVAAVMYLSGNTPSITDDKGNTWPASGASPGTVTGDSGTTALQMFRLNNATAGTQFITFGFGSTTVQPVKIWMWELTGITGTVNGTATSGASSVNSGGIVSPGSMTPTNNNANGGNLILAVCTDDTGSSNTNPALIVPETGYSLTDGDISWNNTQGNPSGSQFYLQATSAATTPRFYLNAGGTDTYNVVAMALSLGTQGTAKPAGIHVDAVRYLSAASNLASMKFQVPSTGNLAVFTGFMPTSGGAPNWTAITDSDGTSYSVIDPDPGLCPAFYYNKNQTPKSNRTMTVTMSGGTGNPVQIIYYDISGAAANPFDTSGFGNDANTAGSNSASFSSVVTPSTTNGLAIGFMQLGLGPSYGISAPAGAYYGLPVYDTADGTGSISGTTFTTTTSWGAFAAANNLLAGANVTPGTSIVSGSASPFVITPSQTAASGDVRMKQLDSDTMSFGNFAAIYYYGSNVSAQTWTIELTNHSTAAGGNFTVAVFKAAAGTAFVPSRPLRRIIYNRRTGFY